MKSIGISEDLPDYLKSRFSVHNPHRRASTAHKSYKSALKQGVSEESPRHFQISYVPVMNIAMKNQEISKDAEPARFSSSLKKNVPQNKARFEYSEIKSQKFDFDTLTFTERLDVKAGHSARIQRAMAYSDHYISNLENGFGISRGDFNVELGQPSVPRFECAQLSHLADYLATVRYRTRHSSLGLPTDVPRIKSRVPLGRRLSLNRQANTPYRKLRKPRNKPSEVESLSELDLFEADIKSKLSLCKSTAIYKDYQ